MRRHLTLLMLAVTALSFVSCEYKELCYDHNHQAKLEVALDWKKIHDADVKGMTALFYNISKPNFDPIRYDFSGMEGGSVYLSPAAYRVMTYNYDTETILYRGMETYQTLEAYTRFSSIEECTGLTRSEMPRSKGTEDQQVILEPDILYGVASEEITLLPNDSAGIKLIPERRYRTMTITIDNVPNLNYTGAFGGSITGMSASRMMASGEATATCVTQAFPASVIDEKKIEMSFRIFGHCPLINEGSHYDHLLTIYAILADGSKWYYTIDITDKIHHAEEEMKEAHKDDPDFDLEVEDIHITLDEGLPLPKPIVNGSGFQPTIDGWQGVEIEVKM